MGLSTNIILQQLVLLSEPISFGVLIGRLAAELEESSGF